MINFFKKIYYKKKLVGFTIIFLSAIFTIPILQVSALDQDIEPINHKRYNNEIFKTLSNYNYQYQELYDRMFQDYLDNYSQEYPYYIMFATLTSELPGGYNTKPALMFWKNMNDFTSVTFTNQFNVSGNEENFIEINVKRGRLLHSATSKDTYSGRVFNTEYIYRKTSRISYSAGVRPLFVIETNANIPLYYKYKSHSSLTSTKTFWFDNVKYNDGDIMINDLSNLVDEFVSKDDYIIRKLYNFQIDLTNSSHLDYSHMFQINYSLYNKPFQNLLKGFEFLGLVNDDGLYYWEKTDECYIDFNDYYISTSYDDFRININNINGNCLDYYEKVKLIVKLDNAYLKSGKDVSINTNSIIHYNFLSDTSVVDILSNYKYVNFTTNKNDINFDLMVRDISGSDFYKRHFFKYFDKANLKTTSEYVRVFIEPYPLYEQMYTTRDVVLNKNKGLVVFTNEVINNEVFMFEYKDVYYSFTNSDINEDVVIIDEDDTPQNVDIDTEFPEPPIEEIENINDGVNSLADGIKAVHSLYSTFYKNLTIEFKILHNLFFMLLITSVVVKVALL